MVGRGIPNELSGAILEHALTKGGLERSETLGQVVLKGASIGAVPMNERPAKKTPLDIAFLNELKFDNVADLKANGACRNLDTSFFFPDGKDDLAIELAKEVCRSCIVQNDCLEYALQAREKFGIWGGESESDRRKILRQRKLALENSKTESTAGTKQG